MVTRRYPNDAPVPVGRDDGESIAIIGKQAPLATQGLPPNIKVTGGVQLISARRPTPRQWVITFMQAVTQKQNAQPWFNPNDGTVTAPTATNTSAPVVPTAASGDGTMQVTLRWGAGGVAFETRFDYPVAGGTLGLTADHVDVNVGLRDPATNVYATADVVPIVGAFMVEGQAADKTPVHWTERQATVVHGTNKFWAVKPYARVLRVRILATNNTGVYRVAFTDASAFIFWAEFFVGNAAGVIAADIVVPPMAEFVEISNADPAVDALTFLAWDIGLT